MKKNNWSVKREDQYRKRAKELAWDHKQELDESLDTVFLNDVAISRGVHKWRDAWKILNNGCGN